MQWIYNYHLFLFDFDGLLVNTEELHYRAYKTMCAKRGTTLPWDFNRYCQAAHYEAEGLRIQIYAACPALLQQEPDWSVLYKEKQAIMKELLRSDEIALMPGAEELLTNLSKTSIKRAVVTHSPHELIAIIREKLPLLQSIPNWITRDFYAKPKPHPECYLKAIDMLSAPNDRIIGFEDTPRGVTALLSSKAEPILVCQADYPEIPRFIASGVQHFHSLHDLCQKGPSSRLVEDTD
ncbi:HAD-superfamily hydrolase [Chlamydiales bacterium STE3]|nr:HAD-superfamily hydrolase [Chlamydiales bacterium STE3]